MCNVEWLLFNFTFPILHFTLHIPHQPMLDYSDIIDLPYPRNDWNFMMKHPRMNVEDRAKIFHPFAALRGHAEALDATAERKQEAVANELTLDENF